jgi:hypothetical protein
MPRPGEKFCPGCDDGPRWTRDVRRVHAWACVGYNFKSDLVFYDDATSANSPGMLSMADYRDKILDGHVKAWIAADHAMVLEEDADSFAHGGSSKLNLAQEWKDAHGLRHHFNCGDSPDLNPVDSLWPLGKQWKLREPLKNWDETTLREAARRAWSELVVEQDRVNAWVDFMPARLKAVVDSDGNMVPW